MPPASQPIHSNHAMQKHITTLVSIPPIQEAIFRLGGLTLSDLANAARVCRAWFLAVSPFLWETVKVKNDQAQNFQDGFKAGLGLHGYWIRTLITDSDQILNWCSESPLCTRLSTIDLNHFVDDSQGRRGLKKLVERSTELKTLRWHETLELEQDFSEIVPGLVRLCPGRSLTTLDLANLVVNSDLDQVLNYYSATIQSLKIEKCLMSTHTFKGLKELSALRILNLRGNEYDSLGQGELIADQLLTLMNVSRNLLEFAFGTVYIRPLRLLPTLLRSFGLISRLETVDLTSEGYFRSSYRDTEALLEAMPGSIINLSLRGFPFNEPGNSSLLNFARTRGALRSIKLADCASVTGNTWLTILSTCPSLVEVYDDGHLYISMVGVLQPWVCMGLELFGMRVRVGARVEDRNDGVVLADCETIFSRLALFSRLKRLQMTIFGHGDIFHKKPDAANSRFLAAWSQLKRCTKMQDVDVRVHFPKDAVKLVDLENLCRDMWGEQVRLNIRKA